MNSRAERDKEWAKIAARLREGPVLLLAGHPDDETIGASWLLSHFPNSFVAFLTDGAPRDTNLWSAGVNGSRDEYANTRREEAICALSIPGIPEQNIFWLHAVDQEAAFAISRLAQDFAELLATIRPLAVVTHPYEGGHPDHDSAAVVARAATTRLNESDPPLLLEMTSYHAGRGACISGEFLAANEPEFVLKLNDDDRVRKRKMLNTYTSQRLVLENFSTDIERLRCAPDYDFSLPPHRGTLWYECMGWPMTGVRWCELAACAIAELQEHSWR